MTNRQLKAKKLVSKAVETFSKAIEEVEKANVILSKEVEDDFSNIGQLENSIINTYKQIDVVQGEALGKKREVKNNEELIGKLKEFTV